MKKIISLLLAVMLVISAMPMAYAADTQDYSLGTAVKYTATNNENYTITVPAKLAPGDEGTVTLEGFWASNTVVSVTAEENVVLTNSILASDTKILNIDFTDENDVYGISEKGNNTTSQKFTQKISVDSIENALFGTWSGKFNYNVEATDAASATYAATFADNSWDDIATACQNNEVPDTWAVGDTKKMTIGQNEVDIMIIGKNHDTYADGTGIAPLTFQTNIIGKGFMNSTATNAGGWDGSEMYSYLNDTLIDSLDDVKNNIKAVNKITNIGYTDAGNITPTTTRTTSDKLFMLSMAEVYNCSADSTIYAEEGTQYEYYARAEINATGQKKNSNAILTWANGDNPTVPYGWRLRTPHGYESTTFWLVDLESGILSKNSSSEGIVFGFCF